MSIPAPIPSSTAQAQTNLLIPTADGIQLVADLYIPQGPPPFPAIVQITPYKARDLAPLGEIYAGRGYLFLAVDCRGRYRSTGDWEPLRHDQADGHAVINWLARQPSCNGRIGSRGHSYCGYNQLLAAIDAPPALQAMVVVVAPGDPFINVPFLGGAYDISDLIWLLGMSGRVCQDESPDEDFGSKRFGTDATEINPYEQAPADHRLITEDTQHAWIESLRQQPFAEVDRRLGLYHPGFREWLRHWRYDEFWRRRSVGERIERIRVPTLFVSGWWDNNGRGSTRFFSELRQRTGEVESRTQQRLLMGPWNHALEAPDCSDLPAAEAQAIQRAAQRDVLNDEFAWMDARLCGYAPGPSTRARVSLYLTGLHRWLDFDDWPPAHTHEQVFYLHADTHPDHRPNDGLNHRLSTAAPTAQTATTTYRFDPNDPTPFATTATIVERGPFDNASMPTRRQDVLVFETPPLDAALALVGEASALLYVEADAPDFDLCIKLLDRYPDGRAIYLTDGVLRMRFRAGWSHPQPVEPGVVQPCRIDLWHLGHLLRAGHALRVEIASAAFPRIDINPCTGDALAYATKTRAVQVRVHHSREHPSQLRLPVCRDPRLLEPD